MLFDEDLNVRCRVNREFPQIFPQPGWVEHDPEAIWHSTEQSIVQALSESGCSGADIAAIGITNQRETTVVWSRRDGRAIHNAIVWQCRRTASQCEELRRRGLEGVFREKTGLVLDAYFSGTKVAWLLDNVEGARSRAESGELVFGTIDTYLLWRLTAGGVHATEVSNASRTLLMNLATGSWDESLCEALDVPLSMLPEIYPTAGLFGETKGLLSLPDGIPITGIAGDQQAALFGQACFESGEAKCTYGTGAFLLMNIGDRPLPSESRLLTTAAWKLDDKITYAFEGSAFIAGAAVQWLRDGLGLFGDSAEVEALAATVEDTGGVVFVPALTGLGAPHWNAEARGVIWGMTRGTHKGHIARAALEGIAFQNYDILEAMEQDLSEPLTSLRVDGGAAANDLLMQFQSDILNVPLVRPRVIETTALGAAMLAGLGAGIYRDKAEIKGVWQEERRFTPSIGNPDRVAHLERWRQGISRV